MREAIDRSSLEFSPALRSRNRELALAFAVIIQNFASGCNFFWPQRASCPLGAQPEWLCSDKTMSARLSDYDYDLPRELIAQPPLRRREDSRMMVLRRAGQTIEHRKFHELKTFLQSGDLLVLNDTRVLPARRFSDDG